MEAVTLREGCGRGSRHNASGNCGPSSFEARAAPYNPVAVCAATLIQFQSVVPSSAGTHGVTVSPFFRSPGRQEPAE